MAQPSKRGSDPAGDQDGIQVPKPTDASGNLSVLIELRLGAGGSPVQAMGMGASIDLPGFSFDEEFQPVPMVSPGLGASGTETYIVRGVVKDENDLEALRSRPEVVNVIPDTPISPFGFPEPVASEAMGSCPIPPCDCQPGVAKGSIADVAAYLGANQIWSAGYQGQGIVVGVLDGGITAQGRTVKNGETSRRIPRVVGGWPSDWGTEASKWGEHGNMCATDVLGMAPQAQIYDLRISGSGASPGTISRALQAFQWAIDKHRSDGTPQVLSNSWGIFQEAWDATYARDPNHPFTRKVVEAINEGILVLFAAGNCGATCPDGRCGPDNGPGRSIWGANGHPLVMTVGAVNKNEEFIGYSSQGPAALDPNKPDFCSISHFSGYFASDSGTSAATPILAGVVALLRQAKPSAVQAEVLACLKATAKDIGPTGPDQHSGAGIVQAKRAFDRLTLPPLTVRPPCPPRTIAPPCPPRTFAPPCPPRTIAPPCPPRTFAPPCPPRTVAPPCPPRPTLACPPRPTLTCPPRPTLACPPQPTLACPPPPRTLACPPRPGMAYPEGEWQGQGAPQPWAYDPYYWAIAALASQYVYGYDPYSHYETGYGYDQFYEESQDNSDQSDYLNLYADPGFGQEFDYGES
jgi:subtilisin family serine protease